jgi:tetratricopeptide (TPR) repeat protein
MSGRVAAVFALLALLLASVGGLTAAGQIVAAARLFDEGNAAFEDGQFGLAIEKYEAALREGFQSGALHTNLGSSYYRMDRLGLSMYHYQQALALTPQGRELRHNIQILQPQLRDQFSRLPEPIWTRWRESIVQTPGLGWLFTLGSVLWLAGSALVVLRLLGRIRSAGLTRVVPPLIATGLFIMVSAVGASVVEDRNERAVVVSQEADLTEESSGARRASVRVHEGLVVKLIDRSEGRVQVQLPNGVVGWVSEEALRVL